MSYALQSFGANFLQVVGPSSPLPGAGGDAINQNFKGLITPFKGLYGPTISGPTTITAGQTIAWNSATTTFVPASLTIDASGNLSTPATFISSGTGNSSFVGSLGIGTTSPSSKLDITTNSLGTTQTTTSGIALVNTSTAASGFQQISPAIRWSGQGWRTTSCATSQHVDFRAYVLPVQGTANPSGLWKLQCSVNGGTYADLLTANSAGRVLINAPTDDGSSALQVSGNIKQSGNLYYGSSGCANSTLVDATGAIYYNGVAVALADGSGNLYCKNGDQFSDSNGNFTIPGTLTYSSSDPQLETFYPVTLERAVQLLQYSTPPDKWGGVSLFYNSERNQLEAIDQKTAKVYKIEMTELQQLPPGSTVSKTEKPEAKATRKALFASTTKEAVTSDQISRAAADSE